MIFGVQGLEFEAEGLGLYIRVYGVRVWGLEFRVLGLAQSMKSLNPEPWLGSQLSSP